MPAPQFLLLAAMAEEREPFLEAADAVTGERPGPTAGSLLTELVLDGIPGQILTTGIGPVNAAAALTGMLTAAPAPARILSVGSAGGLHENIGVGEVIIGADLRYADVDARAFGYTFGQVPGMPETYPAPAPPAGVTAAEYVTTGLLVTCSSFVTADLASAIRPPAQRPRRGHGERGARADLLPARDHVLHRHPRHLRSLLPASGGGVPRRARSRRQAQRRDRAHIHHQALIPPACATVTG